MVRVKCQWTNVSTQDDDRGLSVSTPLLTIRPYLFVLSESSFDRFGPVYSALFEAPRILRFHGRINNLGTFKLRYNPAKLRDSASAALSWQKTKNSSPSTSEAKFTTWQRLL
jgi:hypothetical protein